MAATPLGAVILGQDTRTLAQVQTDRHAEVDAILDARMAAGFPWDFGTADAPNPQTLQVATSDDKTNWLTLMFGCQAAIAAGGGGQPVSPPLRCTSNAQFTPTIAQTAAILQAMQTWGGMLLAASWTIKNAIDACTDVASVKAIDVTKGWPA